MPVFRKDHAPPKYQNANRFNLKRLHWERLFARGGARLSDLGREQAPRREIVAAIGCGR
jgi:hypothetical protein